MKHFRWVLAVTAFVGLTLTPCMADTVVDFCPWCVPGPNEVLTHPDDPIFFGTSATPNGVTVNHPWQIQIGGATITGFQWVDGTGWTTDGVILTGRNDKEAGQSDPDRGIGVCSEGIADCKSNSGNSNELSNQHAFELLQITLSDPNSLWKGIHLSSLDANGGGQDAKDETGQVFVGDGTPGSIFNPGSFANTRKLCLFDIDHAQTNPPCGITPLGSDADVFWDVTKVNAVGQYLYVWAGDGTPGSTDPNLGNDYLLRSVTVNTPPPPDVPEPSSLMLLATGLAGASLGIRRKFRG